MDSKSLDTLLRNLVIQGINAGETVTVDSPIDAIERPRIILNLFCKKQNRKF